MPSQSSPLTLSGQLKLNTTSTFLLVIVFLFALCITSCEGRHLRVSGKRYSSKKSSLTSRDTSYDVAEQVGSKMDRSVVGKEVTLNAKMGLLAASSSGGVRNTGPAVRVRSVERERSVLGVETNREQVGSKATAAYTAENLAAMDYPVAHPAPAVHNR
ncbi:hypothetical protein ABZP36_023310 [Zizania latifolia]